MPVRFTSENGRGRHLNAHLTPEDFVRAAQLAYHFERKKMVSIFPLVLDYLQKHTDAATFKVLAEPLKVGNDVYWGTRAEITHPRKFPPALHLAKREEAAERTKTFQQVLKVDDLAHLRALARYYRVGVDDLVTAAIRTMIKEVKD